MLSSDEQEELNEQAAQYHREDVPWEMMVNMQPPTGKGELKHSGLSKEQLENLIQKIVITVKKEAQETPTPASLCLQHILPRFLLDSIHLRLS